jgi:hypothetical protein
VYERGGRVGVAVNGDGDVGISTLCTVTIMLIV